jgi:hypothetical protein
MRSCMGGPFRQGVVSRTLQELPPLREAPFFDSSLVSAAAHVRFGSGPSPSLPNFVTLTPTASSMDTNSFAMGTPAV